MKADQVIWSEGMFLRPHHFQRQELWFKAVINGMYGNISSYLWGFCDYRIDVSSLAKGKLQLLSAKGVFDDGTYFEMETTSELPDAIKIDSAGIGQKVLLVLTESNKEIDNIKFGEENQITNRLNYYNREVNDLNELSVGRATIEFGKYNARLILEKEIAPEMTTLTLARIKDLTPEGAIVLDEEFIPPLLNCKCNPIIKGYIDELVGLLNQKSEQIGKEVQHMNETTGIEIVEFFFLSILNKHVGQISHINSLPIIHPEQLFGYWLQFATELVTLMNERTPAPPLPQYKHDDPRQCFDKLVSLLRKNLLLIMDKNFIKLELVERSPHLYVTTIPSSIITERFGLILAVSAEMPTEELQLKFPPQMKIGPGSKIRDLVELHLPGVNMKLMPSAPRHIPWRSGYTYFEIERTGELWKQIVSSSTLVMHLAGEFSSLKMELWAIKNTSSV